MRAPIVALTVAVIAVLAASALFSAGDPTRDGPSGTTIAALRYDDSVVSFDGTLVPITVYRPAGATADDPVPVILHSHGWGGSRIKDGTALAGRLWAEGFAVVTIDARGHGDSNGVAEVHHKDFETRDTIAVLDHIHDTMDWVQKEPASGIPKDIVAGGAGYSYAGGMQLMAASYDKRLDAIAPEITWTDLPYALAPEGVPKSVWLDLLLGDAKEGNVRYDPRIDEWLAVTIATNELPPEALDHFAGSSPLHDEIDADVLFIQGGPDVLFNLNHAIRGYHALEARGASDVRIFTHLSGHVLPSLQPFGTTQDRATTFETQGPCGINADIIVAWFDEKLREGPMSGIPEASFALENGECLALDAFPTTTQTVVIDAAAIPSAGGTILLPLLDGPAVLAGTPRLTINGTDAVLVENYAFAGLVVVSPDGHQRVVDDQTSPFRLAPGATVDVDLAGVATRLDAGDKLLLRLDGANEWYAHNSPRIPGATIVRDITITLPVVG